MGKKARASSQFQKVIEQRRAELAKDIAQARAAYRRGDVYRGTAADLMRRLTK